MQISRNKDANHSERHEVKSSFDSFCTNVIVSKSWQLEARECRAIWLTKSERTPRWLENGRFCVKKERIGYQMREALNWAVIGNALSIAREFTNDLGWPAVRKMDAGAINCSFLFERHLTCGKMSGMNAMNTSLPTKKKRTPCGKISVEKCVRMK